MAGEGSAETRPGETVYIKGEITLALEVECQGFFAMYKKEKEPCPGTVAMSALRTFIIERVSVPSARPATGEEQFLPHVAVEDADFGFSVLLWKEAVQHALRTKKATCKPVRVVDSLVLKYDIRLAIRSYPTFVTALNEGLAEAKELFGNEHRTSFICQSVIKDKDIDDPLFCPVPVREAFVFCFEFELADFYTTIYIRRPVHMNEAKSEADGTERVVASFVPFPASAARQVLAGNLARLSTAHVAVTGLDVLGNVTDYVASPMVDTVNATMRERRLLAIGYSAKAAKVLNKSNPYDILDLILEAAGAYATAKKDYLAGQPTTEELEVQLKRLVVDLQSTRTVRERIWHSGEVVCMAIASIVGRDIATLLEDGKYGRAAKSFAIKRSGDYVGGAYATIMFTAGGIAAATGGPPGWAVAVVLWGCGLAVTYVFNEAADQVAEDATRLKLQDLRALNDKTASLPATPITTAIRGVLKRLYAGESFDGTGFLWHEHVLREASTTPADLGLEWTRSPNRTSAALERGTK